MRKMHGEISAALRAAAQIRRVTKHLRERNLHADDIAPRARLRALNVRAPRIQVAKHRRHVFLGNDRSEEHTSELQSRLHLVCRLLLEKKKNTTKIKHNKIED